MRTIQSVRYFGDVPDTVEYDFIEEREHRKRIYYGNVPHILQYGYSIEDEEKTCIGVWRSGKKFNILVKG